MAILTYPSSILPEIHEFGIKYNTQVSTSTINGVTQRVELPGARWLGSMSFRDLTPTESATLKTFLLELRGSSGSFFFGDLSHTSPFNTVTGSPTIAAGSTPRIIRTTVSSGSFSSGDYIQIGADDQRELKMVISSSLVGGNTYDLAIEPMIRRTDYIGLSITYSNPKGVFFLTESDQAKWSVRSKAQLQDISIQFIELFL